MKVKRKSIKVLQLVLLTIGLVVPFLIGGQISR
jgi:hypothetical protein